MCRRAKQKKLEAKLHLMVTATLASKGAAAFLTLTAPPSAAPLHERMPTLALRLRSFQALRPWRGSSLEAGWKASIGIVMGFEFETGTSHLGHPHAHLFLFGQSRPGVVACSEWLQGRWLELNPTADPRGQSLVLLSAEEAAWGPRLSYVLKGTSLNPSWPAEVLLRVLLGLSTRGHDVSRFGLARGHSARVARLHPNPTVHERAA